MTVNKETLLNEFLGQNKNRRIFIGIDNAIHPCQYKAFLKLFDSKNIKLVLYDSMPDLEEKINNFNDTIYILLMKNDIFLKYIKNDCRIFVFKLSHSLSSVKICNITNIINFNMVVENYILLGAYIQYKVLNSSLYVDISKLHGFGLFTSKFFFKEQCIFALSGEVVKKDFIANKRFTGEWNALLNNLYLARKDRTSYGFINHSRKPNCKIDASTMKIIAKSDISKNTELSLDYREEPLPEEYINKFGRIYL